MAKQQTTTKQTKEEALAIAAGRPPCLCGCGGYPKGRKARYLPGHDAKHHSAMKRERVEPNDSPLRGDELKLEVVDEWNLPTDRDGFLAWLAQSGVSLAAFMKMPAWKLAPDPLKAALRAPVPANGPGRPQSPPRRAARRGDTSGAVGSDATGRVAQ